MKLFLLGLALGFAVAALLSLPLKGRLVLSNDWADSETWREQP